MFQSLWARGVYNKLIKFTVDLLMQFMVDLWVVHIAGVKNIIADALSQTRLDIAKQLCLSLIIQKFQPPALFAEAVCP